MTVLNKNPEIIVREEEAGKYLVFNPANGLPLVMNNTAYFIWSLCDGQNDIASIKSKLSSEYDLSQNNISEEELDRILHEHIDILKKANLLVEDEP